MNMKKEKLFLNSASLSDIELYYTQPHNIKGSKIVIEGDEFNHLVQVMRHNKNDEIYITDGKGGIYKSIIREILKTSVYCEIKEDLHFENRFSNMFFCIPRLKSVERMEIALEKSVEIGITNFIIYNAKNAVAKGIKLERWQKILISAMKQSLRSFLPQIRICNSIEEIKNLKGELILLEQNSKNIFSNFIMNNTKDYYFIFGPEGGLNREELDFADLENIYSLGTNRLRTETAVISVASILTCNK